MALVIVVVVGILILERLNFVVVVLFLNFSFGELTHLLVGQEVAEGVELGGDVASESLLQRMTGSS